MKQYIIKYTITSCLILFALTTFGQGLQLATMSDIGQVNLTNPAKMPDKRFYLGISPFLDAGTSISGAQIFETTGGFIPGFINVEDLDDDNFVGLNLTVPFGFGFKVKKWAFNVHSTPVYSNQIGFNKDFLGFMTQGNAPYTGETLNLDPQFDISLYQEFGIGVSRQILGIFDVGIRGKFLVGAFNINTVQGDLSLTTSDDFYQLDAAANYDIQVAGFPQITSLQQFETFDSAFQAQANNPLESFTQNRGFAFDIGATMDIGELLHIGVSILDIGNITWEQNSYEYNLSGEFTFEGVDATGFFTGADITNITDTLNIDNIVSVSSKPTSYKAGVNTKTYLTARLKLGKQFFVNGVLRNEFTPNGVRTGFGVGAQKYFGKNLGIGAMYSIQNGSFANLGTNLSLKLGPAQVFVISDNLLPLINQWQAANTNVRIGANVTLNDKKKK
ncbi:MAG: DUF5723 family protein [Saprospiraceae bacterium]